MGVPISNNQRIYNYKIFKFLKPNDNTKLSEIKGTELQDLLVLLDEVYLSLRKTLGFDEKITFGLEIEIDYATKQKVEEQISNMFPNNFWECDEDDSLFYGTEIISPMLVDKEDTWNNLKKICQIAQKNGKISENCAGHIHVGAQIFDNNINSFFNFIKLWSVYENIIYRFSYGEFLTPRPKIKEYAEPISNQLYKFYKDNLKVKRVKNLLYVLPVKRYKAINFDNITSLSRLEKDNTIEFRTLNGTLEPIIWQNNVNLCVNLLKYSKDTDFNNDIIEKRRLEFNLNKEPILEFYNEIYIEQALELCDLIFNNNFDKIYFLRQYLKSFETPVKEFQKAKRFIKS